MCILLSKMLKSSTVLSDHQYAGLWLGQTYQRRNYSFRSHYDQLQNVSTKTNSRVYVQVYIVQSVWSIIAVQYATIPFFMMVASYLQMVQLMSHKLQN